MRPERERTLHFEAGRSDRGRAFRQSLLCRRRQAIVHGVQAAAGGRQDPRRNQIPGRSGAGAFGDLAFLVEELHAPIDPIYNEAVKREIDKIAAAIPHDELAIQFDVASAVFARLERNEASSYGTQQGGDAGRPSAIS